MDSGLSPTSWGPPRWLAFALLCLAAVLVGVATGVDDAGRLLLGIAAVGVLYAAGWLLGGPALRADHAGIRVRGALRTHTVDWAAVERVRVDSRRRSRAVELETDQGLLAVPALLLGGVSPERVAATLHQLRSR